MTFTIDGQDTFKSKVGGAATILVVLTVLVQSVFVFHDQYVYPNYNQYPTTYDYGYTKQINDFDLRQNMMAYSLQSLIQISAFEYLRITFYDGDGVNIPAIFCKEYFAEEIQAEASGESNSTFYTDTYAPIDYYGTEWVCPNLNKTNITDDRYENINVGVYSCAYAKLKDSNFLSDQNCSSAANSTSYATYIYLYKSLTNSNFVPAQYSSEKTLQKYATVTSTPLSSTTVPIVNTNI